MRQERRTSWKPAAVAGCDNIVEGTREEHGRRTTHSPRPGAGVIRGGGSRGQGAGGGGFGVLEAGLRLGYGHLREGLLLGKRLRVRLGISLR